MNERELRLHGDPVAVVRADRAEEGGGARVEQRQAEAPLGRHPVDGGLVRPAEGAHDVAFDEDPADRRFHAEPVACPDCGPVLTFTTPGAGSVEGNEAALQACIEALKNGQIVAVKGIGGYHLKREFAGSSRVFRFQTIVRIYQQA